MERQPLRLDTLDDLERQRFKLHLECGCGRIEYITALELRAACARAGLAERLIVIQPRLRCSKCGRRAPVMTPAKCC